VTRWSADEIAGMAEALYYRAHIYHADKLNSGPVVSFGEVTADRREEYEYLAVAALDYFYQIPRLHLPGWTPSWSPPHWRGR
jgi:hypothetical protein